MGRKMSESEVNDYEWKLFDKAGGGKIYAKLAHIKQAFNAHRWFMHSPAKIINITTNEEVPTSQVISQDDMYSWILSCIDYYVKYAKDKQNDSYYSRQCISSIHTFNNIFGTSVDFNQLVQSRSGYGPKA